MLGILSRDTYLNLLEGAGEGGEVGVKTPPFDPSPDDLGPMFYADPQEASPPKPAQPEAPHFDGGDA